MIKLIRYKGNPILSPNPQNEWEDKAVFNPGTILVDGKVYLLYRAVGEYDSYISQIGLAISEDGFNFKRTSNKPLIKPEKGYDKWACEDPRITQIGNTFYITYVALAQRIREGGKPTYEVIHHLNSQTALLTTKDFVHFKRHGIITPKNSDNRDVVIFPEKINNKFVVIHRPHRWSKNWFKNPLSKNVKVDIPVKYEDLPRRPAVWIAYANDLTKDWFGHKLIVRSHREEDEKTGAGPPPIKTDKGWLLIYHRVKRNKKNDIVYTARMVLLDLKNPSKVIAKTPYDILKPEEEYEIKGDVDNVVFPTGTIIKKGTLFIYYGAADKKIALATIELNKLLKELLSARRKN